MPLPPELLTGAPFAVVNLRSTAIHPARTKGTRAPDRRRRVRRTSRRPSARRPGRRGDGLATPHALHKGDSLALGPAAIVSVGLSEKGAMAAVRGLKIRDARVLQDFAACVGQNADKRIVVGMQNESRYRDSIEKLRRSRAGVVILRVAKSAIASGDLIVKFPQAAKAL